MTISLSQVLGSNDSQEKFVPAHRTSLSRQENFTAQPVKLPDGSLLPTDPDVKQTLIDTAERYKINPALLMALAQQESNYRADAIGAPTKYGTAKGMMQFLDATAKGHGIDAFDYRQAADAAAKDLAEQITTKGVSWAVGHHHAGSDPKQHGPKTAQYVQEVLAKAQAIAKELGIEFQPPEGSVGKPDFSNVSSKRTGISLGDVLASKPQAKVADSKDTGKATPESLMDTLRDVATSAPYQGPFDLETPEAAYKAGKRLPGSDVLKGIGNTLIGPIQRTISRGWEGLHEAMNRDTETVTYSDQDLKNKWESEQANTMFGVRYSGDWESFKQSPLYPSWEKENRTATVSTKPFSEEEAEWVQRLKDNPGDAYLLPKRLEHLRPRADESRFAPPNTFQGFAQRLIANHKNPIDLMLQDSIPANIVTALFTLPEVERKKFDQARRVTSALEATSNPEGRSPEEMERAEQVLADWKHKTDPSVVKSWQNLWQAAKEDPSQVAQGFSEALFADPYMVAAPAGLGATPIRAARVASGTTLRAGSIARRAERIVDKFLDAGSLTAAINVGAGAAHNLATEGEVNNSEVKLNAAMGYLIGGGLGAVFMKGARARAKSPDAHRAAGTLDEALQDMAKADVELETQAQDAWDRAKADVENREAGYGIGGQQTELQRQISRLLFGEDRPDMLTSKGYESWVQQRRKEVKDWFKNNEDYANYQQYVAEERLSRARDLAAAVEARQRERAEAGWGIIPEDASARTARMSKEFDDAINARNAAEASQEINSAMDAARAEDSARTIADKLNAEEMFYAALSEDHPTIKQTENKIARREAQLRRPKWQRGEADPETLARLAVVGGAAAAGYALFPQDQKLQGALFSGLAGLIVPAGGSVLSRMHQAGAIAADGQIISALVKAGKMANKLEEAEIKARDNAWIEATRTGDQQAFKQLYDTYAPEAIRFANKYMKNVESRTGSSAEDIVQEAFLDVYQKIYGDPEFTLDKPFPAFLKSVIAGDAKNALTAANRLKRKATVLNEEVPGTHDDYSGDLSPGYNLLDRYSETAGYHTGMEGIKDTPELTAIREETLDIIRQAVEKLPEEQRKVFTMVNLEHFSPEEAANQLGRPHTWVRNVLSRSEKLVRRSIEENRRRLGEPADPETYRGPRGQRGSASPEDLRRVAAVAATATAAGAAGYFLSDGDIWKTSVSALLGGPALYALGKGRLHGSGNVIKGSLGGANPVAVAIRSLDYRLKDMGESLYGLAKKHGFQELREIKRYNDATADFVTIFRHLHKDVVPTVIKALSTRDKTVINKVLKQVGGEAFVKAFDKVRVMLDEVEDQLVGLGLIKKSEKDYFPFRVKDLDGLKQAVGKEAAGEIDAALNAAQRKLDAKEGGRPLTAIERDIIINKVLEPYLGKPIGAGTPGFAKARTIQVIDEKLQPFYHDPISTLNSYGVQAIKYIERAKFFGRHLKMRKEEGRMVADIGSSIGELVGDLKAHGKITDDQAVQLAGMLQDRFNGGEMASGKLVQGAKNLSNAMLLGHIRSAITQTGDIILQGLTQGPMAAVRAARRMVMRDKLVDLKNFGMTEHVAHEFLSDGWTRKISDWSFKWGGFRAIDHVGKNFGLNAAIEKMMKEAQSPSGIMKLSDRFQRVFPEDFEKALSALKKGQVNESVELMAFAELTRTQPITSWELPQAYQRMPNGRIVYHLQTFSMRVMNMVYEDALKDVASGSAKRMAKGTKNLLIIGAVLGVQGVAADKLKEYANNIMAGEPGKPIELKPEEIPLNALQAVGMSMYDYNRIQDKGPGEMIKSKITPAAFRIAEDVWNEPERSTRYIPVVGQFIYNRNKDYFEQRRKERRKREGYKMEIRVPSQEEKDAKKSSSSQRSRGRRSGR